MDVDEELARLTKAEPLGNTYISANKRSTYGRSNGQAAARSRNGGGGAAAAGDRSGGGGEYALEASTFSAAEDSAAGDLWLLESRKGDRGASTFPANTTTTPESVAAPCALNSKLAEEDLPTSTSYGMSQLDSPNRASGSADSDKKTMGSSGQPLEFVPAASRAATRDAPRGGSPMDLLPATTVSANRDASVCSKPNRHLMIPDDNCEDFDPGETPSVRRRRLNTSFMQPTESSLRRASVGSVPRAGGSPTSVRRQRHTTTRSTIDDEYDALMDSVCSSARSHRAQSQQQQPSRSQRTVQQRSVPQRTAAVAAAPAAAEELDSRQNTTMADAARSSKAFDHAPEEELYDVSPAAAPPSLSPFQLPVSSTATTDKKSTATRRQSDPSSAVNSGNNNSNNDALASGAGKSKARRVDTTTPSSASVPAPSATKSRYRNGSPESPLVPSHNSPRGRPMRSRVQGSATVQRSSTAAGGGSRAAATGGKGSSRAVHGAGAAPPPRTRSSSAGSLGRGSGSGSGSGGNTGRVSSSSVTTITVSDEDEDTFAASGTLSPLTSDIQTAEVTAEPRCSGSRIAAAVTATAAPRLATAQPRTAKRNRSRSAEKTNTSLSGNARSGSTGSVDGASLEATITAVEEVEGGNVEEAEPVPRLSQPVPASRGRKPTTAAGRSSTTTRSGSGRGPSEARAAAAASSNAAAAPNERSNNSSYTQSHRISTKPRGGTGGRADSRSASEEPQTTFPSVRKRPDDGSANESFDNTSMSVLKARAAEEEERRQHQQQQQQEEEEAEAEPPAVLVPPLPLSSITERRDRANSVAGKYPLPPGSHRTPTGAPAASAASAAAGSGPLTSGRQGTGREGEGTYGDLTTVTISPMSEDDVEDTTPLPTPSPDPEKPHRSDARSSGGAGENQSQPRSSAMRSGGSVAVDVPSPAATTVQKSRTAATTTTNAETGANAKPPAAAAAAVRPEKRGSEADAAKRGGPTPAHVPSKSEQKKCCTVM